MCGRFTQAYSWAEIHAFLDLVGAPRNLRARYNIAPTTEVDVVRLGEAGPELVRMRWGLVPFFWSKSLREVPATFNARAETVAEKPMFRDAFRKRHCVIPASGFYEWTGPRTDRQPHLFTAADDAPVLGLAGLWDRWRDPASGEEMLSCTIVVTGPSAWMAPYHDRMPVLLSADAAQRWLDGTLGQDDLKPAAESALRAWPVSRRVNRAGEGDEDATLLDPIEPDRAAG